MDRVQSAADNKQTNRVRSMGAREDWKTPGGAAFGELMQVTCWAVAVAIVGRDAW
jgi:hypothetical protein